MDTLQGEHSVLIDSQIVHKKWLSARTFLVVFWSENYD